LKPRWMSEMNTVRNRSGAWGLRSSMPRPPFLSVPAKIAISCYGGVTQERRFVYKKGT
jgi:hypothetical protein